MRVVGILCPTVGTEENSHLGVLAMQLQMTICKSVCTHTYMCIHVYVHMCVCICVWVHVCYVFMCTCTFQSMGEAMLSSTLPYNSRTPPVETDYVLTVHLQNLPFFMYFCLLIICHLFNILFTCFCFNFLFFLFFFSLILYFWKSNLYSRFLIFAFWYLLSILYLQKPKLQYPVLPESEITGLTTLFSFGLSSFSTRWPLSLPSPFSSLPNSVNLCVFQTGENT